MRRYVTAEERVVVRDADGVSERVIADTELFGAVRMSARVLELAPGVRAPGLTAEAGETMAYVIRGGGSAHVDGDELPLVHESMLWIEPGEVCELAAGDEGLELLVAHAPGD
jgi:quercetin dioxygenase-like cupin family protein